MGGNRRDMGLPLFLQHTHALTNNLVEREETKTSS